MNFSNSLLRPTGLRSIHDARTRVYAAGGDPLFGAAGRHPTKRLVRPYPDVPVGPKVFRHDLLDRLQAPVTRYRD